MDVGARSGILDAGDLLRKMAHTSYDHDQQAPYVLERTMNTLHKDLLTQLLEGEARLNPQVVAEILGRGVDFIPSLEMLLGNVRLWHTDTAGRIAVFHAVKLLGIMKAASALPKLIDAIFLAYSTKNEDVLEELPIVFSRIGPDAIEPLRSVLEDSGLDSTIRSLAASGLEGIGVLHADSRGRVLDVLRRQLQSSGQGVLLRAHVLGLIVHFRRPEDRQLVGSTLSLIPTAPDMTEDEVNLYFKGSDEPWEWAEYRIDPLEFYDGEHGR